MLLDRHGMMNLVKTIDVAGDLRRLRLPELAGAAPSAEGLFALHRAHAELVPYETLEIWLGRPTTVDPAESVRRILRGRGGYCFHVNGAFSELLMALGYPGDAAFRGRAEQHFAIGRRHRQPLGPHRRR